MITIRIRATDENGKPVAPDLTSIEFDESTLSTSPVGEWVDVTFLPVALTKDIVYSILVTQTASYGSGWRRKSTGGYTGGQSWSSPDSGATWDSVNGDFMFTAKYITA